MSRFVYFSLDAPRSVTGPSTSPSTLDSRQLCTFWTWSAAPANSTEFAVRAQGGSSKAEIGSCRRIFPR